MEDTASSLFLFIIVGFPAWYIGKAMFLVLRHKIFKYTGLVPGTRHPLFYRKVSAAQESVLSCRIPFYKQLGQKEKKLFGHRLRRFMDSKRFEGRAGLHISEEIKVVISAAAIKLTMGHTRYMLPHFETIIVYPRDYYSNYTHTYNKGEANSRGSVVLTWNHILEGFEDEHDRINLGYHEFAHALYLQMLANDMETDTRLFVHGNELKDMFQSRDNIYQEARNSGIIREYGFTNFMEFFAVVTEAFFEQPGQMRNHCPSLYGKLKALYGYEGTEGYLKN